MTDEELRQAAKDACPHCTAGKEPVQRPDTGEWTHTDYGTKEKPGFSHTLCLATHLRNKHKDVFGGQ